MRAWEEFLVQQELQMGKETVSKWLRPLKVLRFDACNLYLEAKDTFQALWFEEHIRPKIVSSFVNNNQKKIKVHLAIGSKIIIGKQPVKSPSKKPVAPPKFHLRFDTLDPLYSFENFLILKKNEITFRLLSGSLDFNPIYLYGPSGSGKTHLLMSLANQKEKLGQKVIYAKTDTFTDHVVNAIRSAEMGQFRAMYRNVDCLILDDVHLFSRKSATQEELFHTFNALHLDGKQIILGANCPPALLRDIEMRLVSRFEWGIVLPLEAPQGEEILNLLKAKALALEYTLPPKVAEFLIEAFPSGPKNVIRALEALILRSHVEHDEKVIYKPISVPIAKQYLTDLLLAEKQHALTSEKIIRSCAEHWGIQSEDILGKAQRKECALPRQIAMYLCRNELKLPFTKIGEIFGRDHSTVMSSIKLIDKALSLREGEVPSAISTIEKKIGK